MEVDEIAFTRYPILRKISKSQINIRNYQKLRKIQYFEINRKTVLGNAVRKLHTKFESIPTIGSWSNRLRQVHHMRKISKSQINFQKCQKLRKIQYFRLNPKTVLGNDVRKLHTKFESIPTIGSWSNRLCQ